MRKLWIGFAAVLVLSFAVLLWVGSRVYQAAPPIPDRVVAADGHVVFDSGAIGRGQNVWRSRGGMEIGSVWGHGAYLAPDWTADWLHRELVAVLDGWAGQDQGKPYAELDRERQAGLRERLTAEYRRNDYDAATRTLTISNDRARAIDVVAAHIADVFGHGRTEYAIPAGTLADPTHQRELGAFFFWSAWAAATHRPGSDTTYTSNWPHEPLIGNRPTSDTVVWTGVSIIVLLAGIGAMAFWFAARREDEAPPVVPERDPLLGSAPTPSQLATVKYFWIVCALIVAQILLGIVAAHYGVEGDELYGIPLASVLPYSVARTWHVQLGIFWIATAWLATGLFMAPAVSGYEPKFQRFGVNFLFVSLLIIVVGSLAGEWFGVQQKLGFVTNFWLGHNGYEYIDLGRFWQIFLLVGLVLWFGLMGRAMWPAFKKPSENRHLLGLFMIASLAIAVFYAAGLVPHRRTNLAIAEYWRWWVVHLWVEGFFEVFATVVIAFLFTRMGLLGTRMATAAVLFSTSIFLSGGIIGTFHHLYFTGTPVVIMALGAVFSAMEVVPLCLIGFEAYENLTLSRVKPWVAQYKWPIYFFVAVAFWNLVGAGLFGFLINTPIALYYMQGLNTTPVHGHTALFGVYGMLGIGLMLFCLKGLATRHVWKTRVLAFAFWSINIGLGLMVLISLLPVGLLQTVASVEHGMWYARSAEFMQTPLMDTLRWLRVVGDTVFASGILALGWFVLGLKTGWSLQGEVSEPSEQTVPAFV
jgi:nitric oxide reductase subunit B